MTHDIDNSNDLVQQSLAIALAKEGQFKKNSNLKSWLFRIVYTTWVDVIRKNKTISNYKNRFHGAQQAEAGNNLSISALNTCIDYKTMLNLLTDKQKAPFHLVCIEGYTYDETAKILGISVGTVASRVSHSRSKFNQYFSDKKKIKKLKKWS